MIAISIRREQPPLVTDPFLEIALQFFVERSRVVSIQDYPFSYLYPKFDHLFDIFLESIFVSFTSFVMMQVHP